MQRESDASIAKLPAEERELLNQLNSRKHRTTWLSAIVLVGAITAVVWLMEESDFMWIGISVFATLYLLCGLPWLLADHKTAMRTVQLQLNTGTYIFPRPLVDAAAGHVGLKTTMIFAIGGFLTSSSLQR